MSHAAREHGNVTVLSGSVSSFVLSLLLSHANTKKKKRNTSPFFLFFFCFWFLIIPVASVFTRVLCSISFCPFSSLLLLLSVFPSGEPVSECRRYVQVRNITKGDCRLDNVEVSFCRGRCLSRTDVTLEVRKRDIDAHTHTHRRYCFPNVRHYWQVLI